MIRIRQRGGFERTTSYLTELKNKNFMPMLDKYGREGVAALSSATPIDTGKTAQSWAYKVTKVNGIYKLTFYNTNIQNGVPIAIILQYGHGTRNGTWVQGIDYINPALKPIFEGLEFEIRREVAKL